MTNSSKLLEYEIQAARYSYRAATVAGHAAGCAIAWGIGQCCCPGRTAIVGRNEARRLEQDEADRRFYLCQIDPEAHTWIDSMLENRPILPSMGQLEFRY